MFGDKNKKPLKFLKIKRLRGLVPGAGLEPARTNVHRILSPACLPIPPPGHFLYKRKERKTGFEPATSTLARSRSTN